MLTYQRIYSDKNMIRYEFYPEGAGEAGVVEFVNGEGRIIQNSKDDFDSFYASHALQIDLNTEKGTIAWF